MGLYHCLVILLCFFVRIDLPLFATSLWSLLYAPLSSLTVDDLANFIEIWSHQIKLSLTFHYWTYKSIYTCTNFLLSLSYYIIDVPSLKDNALETIPFHPFQESYFHVFFCIVIPLASSYSIPPFHQYLSPEYVYASLLCLANYFPEPQFLNC